MGYLFNLGTPEIFITGKGLDNIGIKSCSAEKNTPFFMAIERGCRCLQAWNSWMERDGG
jgi:hypothetical protein